MFFDSSDEDQDAFSKQYYLGELEADSSDSDSDSNSESDGSSVLDDLNIAVTPTQRDPTKPLGPGDIKYCYDCNGAKISSPR